MDTIEMIRELNAWMRDHTDDSMKDTTVEQFNWAPPGTASPISAIFIHMMTSEDYFFQTIMHGNPRLWETEGWGEKTGVTNTPDYGGNWDAFKHMTLAMQPVLAYAGVIRAVTDAYLDKLTPDELERKVMFAGSEHSVAYILIHTISHSLTHTGEIALLKGIQGVKGLPY